MVIPLIAAVLLALLFAGCGDSPNPAAPSLAPGKSPPVCREIYHRAETKYVGNNTFIQTPAWTETICS